MLPSRLTLPAAALLLGTGLPLAALAQTTPSTPPPAGTAAALTGAWGDDSSCLADVAVFRADGTVVSAGAPADAPVTTYAVNGNTITFTQGQKTAEFAFGQTGQAVAWSNGSAMVLKERCADQSPFAAETKTGAATPAAAPATATATAPVPLFDQVKALAAQPVVYNGVTIKILSVEAQPASAKGNTAPAYGEIVAHPDPQAVGTDATLLYRIFPSEKAAEDHVSLSHDQQASFVYAGRSGPGYFATDAAKDEGPADAQATPVTINCLRFHPKGRQSVTISCFAHMPGTPLVAGGEQSFPLDKKADKRDMGPKEDLTEVLDLTGIAISRLRSLATAETTTNAPAAAPAKP